MNLYVANIDLQAGDDELNALFSKYGKVSSAKVIMDSFSGNSRGFGFVEMPDDEEGQKAIDDLNNQDFAGKKLAVSVARPKEERKGSYPVGGNSFKKRY